MQSCFSLFPSHDPAPLIPHLPRILRLDEVPDQILGIQGWDNQGGAALDIKEPWSLAGLSAVAVYTEGATNTEEAA